MQPSKRLIPVLRKVRTCLFVVINPFDALFRIINKLGKYPPIYLRRHVGHLGSIDGTGTEFAAYMKLLVGLKYDSRVLDLGCGCGLLELALEDYLANGEIVGVDIHGPSINWANKNIHKRKPGFRFIHADIYNEAYWPKGKLDPAAFFHTFGENNFDVIVAKSLFTHMLPDELDIYLQEVGSRLKTGGKAILTFFILSKEQSDLCDQGMNAIVFNKYDSDGFCAVRYLVAPTAAVAYEYDYIKNKLTEHGLQLACPVYYGSWSGANNAIDFQDLVIAEKMPQP